MLLPQATKKVWSGHLGRWDLMGFWLNLSLVFANDTWLRGRRARGIGESTAASIVLAASAIIVPTVLERLGWTAGEGLTKAAPSTTTHISAVIFLFADSPGTFAWGLDMISSKLCLRPWPAVIGGESR